MVIRGVPQNIEDYIEADNELSKYLQLKGLCPTYITSDRMYFAKTNELLSYIEKYKKQVG